MVLFTVCVYVCVCVSCHLMRMRLHYRMVLFASSLLCLAFLAASTD